MCAVSASAPWSRRAPVRLVFVAAASCGLRTCEAKGGDNLGAIVSVTQPANIKGSYFAYWGGFSRIPEDPIQVHTWAPVEDPWGCSDYKDLPVLPEPSVSVVRRGNCTFASKTAVAQSAGLRGVVIISDTEAAMLMDGGNAAADTVSIFAMSIPKSLGDGIIAWDTVNPQDRLKINIKTYAPTVFDLSELLLILVATGLVALGAYFATSDLRVSSPLAPRSDEVMEMDKTMAVSFCFMGSCMLVVMFFLMKYLIYVLMFMFCAGGGSCLVVFGSTALQYLVPRTRRVAFAIPLFGPVTVGEAVACIPAGLLVGSWLYFRNTGAGWLFQDVIGAGFLCMLQRTLRLPNMQVASLLLTVMFFFDIFWVFLSPLLFGKSVMVEVAKGGGTGEAVPMLLRMPSFDDYRSDRMLGFGDIALPGLLVSYLRRYDILSKKGLARGYFLPSLAGYFVGLCMTIVALEIMRMGQPALLYLVPMTLGTTVLLGLRRKELTKLWDGATPEDSDPSGPTATNEGPAPTCCGSPGSPSQRYDRCS